MPPTCLPLWNWKTGTRCWLLRPTNRLLVAPSGRNGVEIQSPDSATGEMATAHRRIPGAAHNLRRALRPPALSRSRHPVNGLSRLRHHGDRSANGFPMCQRVDSGRYLFEIDYAPDNRLDPLGMHERDDLVYDARTQLSRNKIPAHACLEEVQCVRVLVRKQDAAQLEIPQCDPS